MTYPRGISLIGGLTIFLTTGALQAGPIDASRHPHPENIEMVHKAEHSVDHAWEVYHRAALGGTVASPDLQAQIEQHLHEESIPVAPGVDGQVGHVYLAGLRDGCGEHLHGQQ